MNLLQSPRFGFRTIAALVFFIAVACAFPARRLMETSRQAKLVSSLRDAGAKVTQCRAKYQRETFCDQFYNSIGFPPYLHGFNLNLTDLDDFDRQLLAQGLQLRGVCFITIDGSTIAGLSNPEIVELISDNSNPNLRFIDISESDFNSEDLMGFLQIPSLKTIYISLCPNITKAGKEKLIAEATTCDVRIHVGKGIVD